MSKYSLALMCSFFTLCFSSVSSMEIIPPQSADTTTTDYSKEKIKQLITKYQFNDESTYLAQLLSLNKDEIEKKLTEQSENLGNPLQKLMLTLEAFYLKSETKNDIEANKKKYRTLSLKYHPDKAHDEEKRKEYTTFFQDMEPLLKDNKPNNHLNTLIESIYRKRQEILDQADNPSALTYAAHFYCSTALPILGEAFGALLCNKTVAKWMPSSMNENIVYNACVTNARSTALEIEMKLARLSHRL